MGKSNSVDAEALLRIAKAAESHESFSVVKKGRGFRIGTGVRKTDTGRYTFFIEAVVSMAPPSPTVDVDILETKLRILKRLAAMGYALTYQDDLSIVCEAEFPEDEIAPMLESLVGALAKMP